MRIKLLVVLAGTICLGLAVSAQADVGNWNVTSGNWSLDTNWAELAVPSAAKAYVRNGGIAILDYAAPDITEFDIESGSTVEVKPLAQLTGSGYWKVGDNGTSGVTGTLLQTGGALKTTSDLYLGDDDDDHGVYEMDAGSLEIGDDLKLGDDGIGLFELRGGTMTVNGYVGIANKSAPSVGTFKISGGVFNHLGDAGGNADDTWFMVSKGGGPGLLQVTGGLADINVNTYMQGGNGTLEIVLDATGISTIDASGGMELDGTIKVSLAGYTPILNDSFDLIVAQGTRTGTFAIEDLADISPLQFEVSYATGSEIVRLTVVPEPATMSLLVLGGLALLRRRRRA